MRFFLDNCVAKAMARGCAEFARAQHVEVIHLTDRFAPDTPDVDWIVAIKDEGWVLVSGDTRITRNPVERAAWHESGLTAFFLDDGWSSKKFWVQGENSSDGGRSSSTQQRVARRAPGFASPSKAGSQS